MHVMMMCSLCISDGHLQAPDMRSSEKCKDCDNWHGVGGMCFSPMCSALRRKREGATPQPVSGNKSVHCCPQVGSLHD